MNKAQTFSALPVGHWFRIPGYDDLLLKRNETQCRSFGCGFLSKPVRLLPRKGAIATIQPNELIHTL